MRLIALSPDVTVVYHRYATWSIVRDADRYTLVDSGYPRGPGTAVAVLDMLGIRKGQVVAGVLTHGHSDHQGGFSALRAAGWEFPIYAAEAELPNIRREVTEQITVADANVRLLDPRMAAWAAGALRRGGLDDVALSAALHPLPASGQLDVPGQLTAVPTSGHTSGHTAYYLPGRDILFTGDALVTGHPSMTTLRPIPRTLPAVFDHDAARAAIAAENLRRHPARTIVPGHGMAIRRR